MELPDGRPWKAVHNGFGWHIEDRDGRILARCDAVGGVTMEEAQRLAQAFARIGEIERRLGPVGGAPARSA